jgi:hypothetical protein
MKFEHIYTFFGDQFRCGSSQLFPDIEGGLPRRDGTLLKEAFQTVVFMYTFVQTSDYGGGVLLATTSHFACKDRFHRWALSPIIVISDIRLSLISELPISDLQSGVRHYIGYRNEVLSNIRYPTSRSLML